MPARNRRLAGILLAVLLTMFVASGEILGPAHRAPEAPSSGAVNYMTTFAREMLATDEPRRVFAVLLASRLVAALATVMALVALGASGGGGWRGPLRPLNQ